MLSDITMVPPPVSVTAPFVCNSVALPTEFNCTVPWLVSVPANRVTVQLNSVGNAIQLHRPLVGERAGQQGGLAILHRVCALVGDAAQGGIAADVFNQAAAGRI